MIRVLLSDSVAVTATGVSVSYGYPKDTPDDKQVFIEVEQYFSDFEIELLRRSCSTAEIADLQMSVFYYDMSKWSFEDALEDAKARVRKAVIDGWGDLSDLMCD